jgi:hypothetical protein
MPIDIICESCGKKLRVGDSHAGKRGKCPNCDGIIQIPAVSAEQWFVQLPDGQQYGPISRSELDTWVEEGRVDHECQLLQEGWEQWKWADEVYPKLSAEQPAEQPAEAAGPSETPFDFLGQEGQAPAVAEENPFAAPSTSTSGIGAAGDASQGYTPAMMQALAETKPWVLLFSILVFIGVGLGGIVLLFMLVVALRSASVGGIVSSLISVAILAIYFFAGLHLLRYSQGIGFFLRTNAPADLEKALTAQKSFWKLVGIVTAVAIGLYVLVILLAFLGVGFAMRGL